MKMQRIISGGQTGADRGGLEAAIALGIPHAGWCPRGRFAEDGFIPLRYLLEEDPSSKYADRTFRNIANADATIVFVDSLKSMGAGSQLTVRTAAQVRKPCILIKLSEKGAVSRVRGWLRRVKPSTLNVAGSRESTTPGIQEAVKKILIEALGGAKMRFVGKGLYYCACCGYDCSAPDRDGNAQEMCPSRDGDLCSPKRRGRAPARSKPRSKSRRRAA